jgi:hypothetical protein
MLMTAPPGAADTADQTKTEEPSEKVVVTGIYASNGSAENGYRTDKNPR